jgi:hypothetical protein
MICFVAVMMVYTTIINKHSVARRTLKTACSIEINGGKSTGVQGGSN